MVTISMPGSVAVVAIVAACLMAVLAILIGGAVHHYTHTRVVRDMLRHLGRDNRCQHQHCTCPYVTPVGWVTLRRNYPELYELYVQYYAPDYYQVDDQLWETYDRLHHVENDNEAQGRRLGWISNQLGRLTGRVYRLESQAGQFVTHESLAATLEAFGTDFARREDLNGFISREEHEVAMTGLQQQIDALRVNVTAANRRTTLAIWLHNATAWLLAVYTVCGAVAGLAVGTILRHTLPAHMFMVHGMFGKTPIDIPDTWPMWGIKLGCSFAGAILGLTTFAVWHWFAGRQQSRTVAETEENH